MGIRGLNTLIKKLCPECMITRDISYYSGKTFIIDASILIYKFRHVSSTNEILKLNSHIIGFINRVKFYTNNNIKPIFVFDGKPPVEKQNTLIKRQQNKKKIQEKIELLKDITCNTIEEKSEIEQEIKKLESQIIYVTKEHVNECKKLLDLVCIDYYDAPDEAEKYCVYLYKNGYGDYIISDDTDVFTFGGNKVLKSSIKNNILEINLDLFLEKIEYPFSKFIDLCILAGCDYLSFIPLLGINTVYTLFKKYNCIEDIIKLNKYIIPEDYDYKNVRLIFTEYNYTLPENKVKSSVDKIELKNFLEEFQIKNVIKILDKF